MNRTTRRTLLVTALLSVLLMSLGFGAAAQEPLPLRPAAGQALDLRISPAPDLIAPDDMGEMRYFSEFKWKDSGAVKYKVVFTEQGTGIKHRLKVLPASCNTFECNLLPRDTSIFSEIQDGMVLTWRVTAVMGDGSKLKSDTRMVIVNEVIQPVLVSPTTGANLSFMTQVSWQNSSIITESFRLVVIEQATGTRILNQYINPIACNATCDFAPRFFMPHLTGGATYEWYVKAIGFTGESAVSETRTFVAIP